MSMLANFCEQIITMFRALHRIAPQLAGRIIPILILRVACCAKLFVDKTACKHTMFARIWLSLLFFVTLYGQCFHWFDFVFRCFNAFVFAFQAMLVWRQCSKMGSHFYLQLLVWRRNSLYGKLACPLRSGLIIMVLLTLACGIARLTCSPVPQYGANECLEAMRRARLQEYKHDVQLAMLGGGRLLVCASWTWLCWPYLHLACLNKPEC